MSNKHSKTLAALLTLSGTLALTACNNMVTIPAPDTQPIAHTETSKPEQTNTAQTPQSAIQCPTFDPTDHKACTMQFDPVCVKERTAEGQISYRTAGNACSACNSATAVSYTPGQCQ